MHRYQACAERADGGHAEDMAELIMKGAAAAETLCAETAGLAARLSGRGVSPCLAVLRVGERDEDISYERSAAKRCGSVGISVRSVLLPADADEGAVKAAIEELNRDRLVHGILLMLPLPAGMDTRAVCDTLSPQKDVDGVSSAAMADLYEGRGRFFAPCTAQACMELLHHYGVDVSGRRAVVIGRSIVIGRPVSMLLLRENATVTLCHRHTENLPEIIREADIVIAAAGEKWLVEPEWLRPGQVVLDVGTNWDEELGRLCGDVSPEGESLVSAFSPVPGGVGAVTTAVLARHVAQAAEMLTE